MALGLLTPIDKADPLTSKRRTMALAEELQARFQERFGHLRCRDLLANAAGFEATDATPAAKELGLTKHCEIMVVTAVEIVEQIIAERDAK
ncbi:MAG: C_GCAxxG_C_C family protein, partial [Oscillospiraceae bacterium]|nr:C_GCAxxG_C_C family protein [Oscillospiraceae bacterium]